MRNDVDQLQNILQRFSQDQEKLNGAIAQHNYTRFLVAFKDASKCMRELRILIEVHCDQDFISEHHDRIYTAVADWLKLADGLENWQDTVKDKAEQLHKTRLVDQKLSKAYSYMKKSGNKLRLYR